MHAGEERQETVRDGDGSGFWSSRVLEREGGRNEGVTAMVAGAQDRAVEGSAEQSTAHEVS